MSIIKNLQTSLPDDKTTSFKEKKHFELRKTGMFHDEEEEKKSQQEDSEHRK